MPLAPALDLVDQHEPRAPCGAGIIVALLCVAPAWVALWAVLT